MKKYGELIKELRAKNLTDTRIKQAILEKAKKEINNFQMPFKSFSVKADAGAEAGKVITIEGYASTKDIDRYGDIVNPKAFEETIPLFMTNPVMLLQHDHDKRIWDFTELNIDENGLYVKGDVKYTAGDSELFAKIENKSLKGFSIWFRVLEAEFQDMTDEKGNVIDWIFIINKLDLIEISVVNVPANPYTLMKSIEDLAVKSAEDLEIEDLETPNDGEANENENQEENLNPNEEEKEIKLDDGKVEDQEAENNGGDIEAESEDEAEAEKEKNNIDENEENNIVENEQENLENPNEKKDGDREAEEDSKAFTTKAIEKIVDARLSGNEKIFKTLVEKEVKNLTKEFEKQIEAVKSTLEKELDQIVELVKQVKETEESLVEQIRSTVKGKGFINLKTSVQKEKENNRLAYILSGVKNNKF